MDIYLIDAGVCVLIGDSESLLGKNDGGIIRHGPAEHTEIAAGFRSSAAPVADFADEDCGRVRDGIDIQSFPVSVVMTETVGSIGNSCFNVGHCLIEVSPEDSVDRKSVV